MRAIQIALLSGALGVACSAPPQTVSTTATPTQAGKRVQPDVPATSVADTERTRRATALVEAFTNIEPVFTRDGKKLLFISNRDGLAQLYLGDDARRAANPQRLLNWPERMASPLPTPDGKAVIFRSDVGANENWSYYRVGLDGRDVVELTPGQALNRDPPILVDGAPNTLFYSARAASDVGTVVYSSSVASPGQPRRIYHSDKPGFLTDVSGDGRFGLFVHYPTNSENYLLLLDLASGEAKPLYPSAGHVSIRDADFSVDGRRAFVATDGGAEQALLLALDVTTGQELARYVEKAPATAEIQNVVVSKRHGRLAVALSAGNRSELRLLDARSLKPVQRIEMPLGTYYDLSVAEDGSRFAVTWSTPDAPTDVYAVGARSGKVFRLREEARPSVGELTPLDVSIATIKSHDGLTIPINVYLPRFAAKRKNPVIVAYHGGPAWSYEIRWSAFARYFMDQGYVWVEPNVRGSTGFGRAYEEADNGPKRLDAFKDIEASARWVAAQPWADKDRMVVYGGSYGGYTTLIALTRQAELWRAGVNLFGVANMKTFMATTTGLIREIFLLEFGDPDKDAAFLDSISPLRDADRIVDPLFVYAGANDPRVPLGESDQIVETLRARKVPVEYMVKDNEGHSLARRENQVEFMVRSARFLEMHAK